jgi:hypothetical protein
VSKIDIRKLSTTDLKYMMWKRGNLRYLLHPHTQTDVYNFIHNWKDEHPDSALPLVLNLHRAAGKTFELALLGLERGFKWPGQIIRFGSKSISQADQIVEPNVMKILDQMPPGFKAVRKEDQKGPRYYLWNPCWPAGSPPSIFWLIGCLERAAQHRGKRSHMIILDECREIDNFEYISTEVFGPHFATMRHPISIMCSTPPESMDHAWTRIYLNEAAQDNRYFECNSEKNKDWTDRDDKMMLEIFKSKTSPAWRREMGCERISDPTRLIVPEFDDKIHTTTDYERPNHIIPLVVADGGFIDYFACLYGYVDFVKQILVVEDSIIVNRKNTGDLAELIGSKRNHLFGKIYVNEKGLVDVWFEHKPRLYAEMTPRELADLDQIYGIGFAPAEKINPEAQIATLRDGFSRGRVKILTNKEKTLNAKLIYQLRNGILNEKGKLTRSQSEGHWDGVMALTYMYNMAPWHANPFPKVDEFDAQNQQRSRIIAKEKQFTYTPRSDLRSYIKKRFN